MNFYLLLEENQQQIQFDWLIDTLETAGIIDIRDLFNSEEFVGEKVIILGHIASGDSIVSNFTTYALEYVNIINRFQDIIVGQVNGCAVLF